MNELQKSIIYLNGVGPNRHSLLKNEFGIDKIQDLIHFFPNKYIDRTKFYKINKLSSSNSEVQVVGSIVSLKTIKSKSKTRLVGEFSDDSGTIELIWFRGHKWILSNLKINTQYVVFGKINNYKGSLSMAHPEMELLTSFKLKKRSFNTIYPTTEKSINAGITQNILRKMFYEVFESYSKSFRETLPTSILKKLDLISNDLAIRNIHFPQNIELLAKAERRLKFEELFYLQIQILLKNYNRKTKIKGHIFSRVGDFFNIFFNKHLSFNLTKSQMKVIKEIRHDVGTGRQMNRLLQGDVGSGKTIVAFMTMLIAIDNKFQACLMAPTEILAQQHYKSIKELTNKLGLNVALITGSTKKNNRSPILKNLKEEKINILIGTHTLIEDSIIFNNLGIAIIDEQHKFGVAQRSKLWTKNSLPPHILVMTATPIPRTLAMTLYGDLDVSIIDELPPGRKLIKTVHRNDSKRLSVFNFIKNEIIKGRQIYIVYPLIEESKKMDYKDLLDGFESISRSFPLPDYKISILNGRMKNDEKEYEMNRFIKGETQIMVSTTVIEVGVNVPNASVMIIESSERFGLSQLHQLRGRVGRGNSQSYCILMTGDKLSSDSKLRINTMVKTNNGFEIADVDLKIRGPGNLMGTQQSGILKMKIADLINDNELLNLARKSADEILSSDKNLEKKSNQCIKYTLSEIGTFKNIWNYIS